MDDNHRVSQLVIKFGTGTLLGPSGYLDQQIFSSVARQVVAMQERGTDITIISSGAIKAGRERMEKLRPNDIVSLNKKEGYQRKRSAGANGGEVDKCRCHSVSYRSRRGI